MYMYCTVGRRRQLPQARAPWCSNLTRAEPPPAARLARSGRQCDLPGFRASRCRSQSADRTHRKKHPNFRNPSHVGTEQRFPKSRIPKLQRLSFFGPCLHTDFVTLTSIPDHLLTNLTLPAELFHTRFSSRLMCRTMGLLRIY